jgi:hypothetical protein
MDRYQERMIKHITFTNLETDGKSKGVFYRKEQDLIEIKQDDDITITKYPLTFKAVDLVITDVSIIVGGKSETQHFTLEEIDGKIVRERLYNIVLDFENRIDTIEFKFHDNFADPLRINVIYIEADKAAYHAKQESLKQAELIAAMNVSHRTGLDLVNIYWQYASPEVEITKIDLYVKEENERMKIASYNCDNETMFKSIGGLAFGDYEYQLAQFKKDKHLVAHTPFIPFRLSPATPSDTTVVRGGPRGLQPLQGLKGLIDR